MLVLGSRLGQWAVGVILLIALLAGLAAAGVAAPIEDAASTVFGPIQRGLRQGAEPVANLLSDIDEFDRLDDENRALRNRIEQLESENARLREEQIQVRGRQELVQVQEDQADEIFVTSSVITRDLSGLRNIIGIDRGSDAGVVVGMPVVAGGGTLVGVIIDVRGNSSFVRLITDPESSVRVLHQLSRSEGIVSGDTLGNLNVAFIPQATDVQPGQLFVSSGFGGLLPKGIPVGRVSSTSGTAQDVFKSIRLQPLAPLNQLETVLVQVTFTPEPVGLPNADAKAAAAKEDAEGEETAAP